MPVRPRRVSFAYERRPSAILGTTPRPVAQVELYSWRFGRWLSYTMVVDTGADFCVLPSPVAQDLGLERRPGTRHAVSGIGGQQAIVLYHRLPMRLGPWQLQVTVGVVARDDLPPLLGRHRCLDAFDLRLRHFVSTFLLLPSRRS